MRLCTLYLAMLILVGAKSLVYGQSMIELDYEKISATGIIPDSDDVSLLIVESTIAGLKFNSRAGIKKFEEPDKGIYHVILKPGVHIIEISTDQSLPLLLPRINFTPKTAHKFRVRKKEMLGAIDQFNATRPELRLLLEAPMEAKAYVKLDEDPPQVVDFSNGYITLRPAPGPHVVRVYVGKQQWDQTVSLEAGQKYEETVRLEAMGAEGLTVDNAGNLFIDSNPQGAKVLLNQVEQRGQTPLTLNDLQPGIYQIEVVLAQHRPEQRQLEVKSLEYTKDTVELIPTYGELSIDSDPTGAVLYVNGDQVGTTPHMERRNAGLYRLRFVTPFYYDEEDTLVVDTGSVIDTTYSLRPRFGQLIVESKPMGAEVLLDGKAVGRTPLKREQVISGEHYVEVALPPYETLRRSITVRDGQSDTTRFDLSKTVGRLRVESQPSGAEIRIRETGQRLGATPLNGIELSEGGYTLLFGMTGHDGLERPVEIKRGEETKVDVELIRHVGMIRVESMPPDAEISINGKAYGSTPQIISDLPTDVYRVRLWRDGYDPSVANLEVRNDTITDHRVELSTRGVSAWKKRRATARRMALIPGMGLGQLESPGQGWRGLFYLIAMGGAAHLAYDAHKDYEQARDEYDTALASYASATSQVNIDRHFAGSVDAHNRMDTEADQFKWALTGLGVVYAVQLLDALIFGGGDIPPQQVGQLGPTLQVSGGTYHMRLNWDF